MDVDISKMTGEFVTWLVRINRSIVDRMRLSGVGAIAMHCHVGLYIYPSPRPQVNILHILRVNNRHKQNCHPFRANQNWVVMEYQTEMQISDIANQRMYST